MMENKGILYLVPSPIGNLSDISKRIIDTLNSVDYIFCEDTRNTQKLLNLLNIKKTTISCHEHNEKEMSFKLISYLSEGKNIAYMSDAGYPAISDPGEILVKEVSKNNFKIIPLSGPTASLTALIASSLPTSHFLFYGFLSSKHSERIKEINELKSFPYTIIFYEAPHRINETLDDLYNTLGDRKITIARELSKEKKAVILSSDELVASLYYPNQNEYHDLMITKIQDYLLYKSIDIINAGVSVILDWGFWTKNDRKKITDFYHKNNIEVKWYYINISNKKLTNYIKRRNQEVSEGKSKDFFVDEGLLQKMENLFEIPQKTEIDVWYDIQ